MPVTEEHKLSEPGAGVAIPNLRKKKDERKKAGAAWGSGKGAGGAFSGAAGGEGAVGARAAAGVARAAASAARALGTGAAAEAAAGAGAAEGGFFAGLLAQVGAVFSSLTATVLGKLAVAAAAALAMGLAAVVGYRITHPGAGSLGLSVPDLGGIASTVKVDRGGGNAGLGYSGSGQGLLRSQTPPAEPAKSEPGEDTGGLPPEGANGSTELRDGAPIDRMAHNLSGAKLSGSASAQSDMSNGLTGSAANLPKVGAQSGALAQFGQGAASSGKGGALVAKNVRLGSGMSLKHLSSNGSKSLALLRGMASKYNASMRSGGAVATETNSNAATSQYESSELVGGTPPTSPTDNAGPGGPGAGSGTGGGGGSGVGGAYTPTIDDSHRCDYEGGSYWNGSACVTMDASGHNVTPWQSLIVLLRILTPLSAVLLCLASYMWIEGHHLGQFYMSAMACQIATIVSGVIGALIAVLGIMVAQMGGGVLGDIIAGMGAGIAALATWVYMIPAGGNMANAYTASIVLAIASVGVSFLGAAATPTGLAK